MKGIPVFFFLSVFDLSNWRSARRVSTSGRERDVGGNWGTRRNPARRAREWETAAGAEDRSYAGLDSLA